LFKYHGIGGRKPYHGKNEVVKNTGTIDESLKNIVSKVEVLKLSDYIKLNQEDKFGNNKFVCRYLSLNKQL